MTAIHVPYTKLSYQIYSHKHIHLHYILQLVLAFLWSAILSVELSSEQNRTISNIPYRISYCMLIKPKAMVTLMQLALYSSELNQTYHVISCLAFILHTFWFCLFGKIHLNLTNIYIFWHTKQLFALKYVSVSRTLPHIWTITEKNHKKFFFKNAKMENITLKYFRE